MEQIVAKELKHTYKSDEEKLHVALDGVTLSVRKGSFVAVLGHNGSGKSTFAKHINVLLPVQEGELYVDEMDARVEENLWEIRRRAGMVFQNPDNQIVATIVEEDVAFGPENLGVPQPEIVERVQDSLRTVGMTGFEKRAPHMLSGGQKQRIAIAGVLAMHPDILVFDEPTAMLDPQGRGEVMATIRKLNKEQGKTIVFITHYMEEVAEADEVFVMQRGKLIAQGTPQEVFAQDAILKEAGLMPPLASQLYLDLKRDGMDLGECPVTLERAAQLLGNRCWNSAAFCAPQNRAPQGEPVMQIKGLNYTYGTGTPFEVQALKDINLDFYEGEFVGIIGHTGCGKTTLIQQIDGLMKPDGGEIRICGEDINAHGYDRKKLRRQVGMVFQYPEYQLFEETVARDIAFGPLKAGLSEEEAEQRVRMALELMELDYEGIKDVSPFDLSGGQKRKVAIAGVLALQPRILILDEPIAGLDPVAREEFMRLLRRLNEAGTTILMISHNMDGLCDYASRVLVMRSGEVRMDGTPHEIFADVEALREQRLGVSEARMMAYLLREQGCAQNIITKDELVHFLIAEEMRDD